MTRPLEANDELRHRAQNELAHLIEASPQATDEMLEDAAAKLELVERKIWRKWGLPLVGAVALVSLAVVVGTTGYRFMQFRGFFGMVSPVYTGDEGPPLNPLAKKLSPDVRLLMFGHPDADNAAEKWQPLWESDRSNPAFLQAYAEGCLSTRKELPLDLLKQAETIDPRNAYLATLAAGYLADSSVERKSGSWSTSKNPEAPKWMIKDQARFDQAYEALRKAADLPSFKEHNITLNQQRFRHLPPGRDFLDRISVVAYTAALPSPKIGIRHLANLLAAKASTFDAPADIAEFTECVRLWRWLVEHSAETHWTIIDGLITKAMIQAPLKNFRDAAARLGLEDASRDFRLLDEKLVAEKEQRKARGKEDPISRWIETKGSVMACLQMPVVTSQVNSPPVLSEDDFKPGRLTDYALLGQAHTTITAVCFGLLALGALLSRAMVPHATKLVARRLADLISPCDRMLLFVVCIFGPLGFYFALIQIPHLSARDWSMRISGFIAPVGQLAALTVLMINLSIALGAWLTRSRLSMLEPARRSWRRFLPWVGVASSILVMLVCGIFPGPLFQLGVVLAPLWIGAVIVSCLLFALHRSDEFKWTERDRLLAPDPEVRGMSHIEGVVAKQLASEVQNLIKALPRP